MTDQPSFVLALDEARRGFDQQLADLGGLRDRAGALLGVGGLAASFLGGLAIRDGAEMSKWTWGSVGAFCVLAALCLAIFWPRKIWSSQDPALIVEWTETPDVTDRQMERDLALHMGEQYEENRGRLVSMQWMYCGAVFVLGAEIAALLMDLRSR